LVVEHVKDWLGQEVRPGDVVRVSTYYGPEVVVRVKRITPKCVVFDVTEEILRPGTRARYDFSKGYGKSEQQTAQFMKLPEEYLGLFEEKIKEYSDGGKV